MEFSKLSASQLAVMVLVDSGQSKEEAALALVNDPAMVGRLADKIEAKRETLERQVADAERQAFEASPEGRRRAALAAQAKSEERTKLVSAARAMLEAEHGDVSGFTDEEVFHVAGIERKPELMSMREKDAAHVALAERVAAGHIRDDETLIREAEAVAADPHSIVRYARSLRGGEE